MWMPAHTTVAPRSTAARASGTRAPAEKPHAAGSCRRHRAHHLVAGDPRQRHPWIQLAVDQVQVGTAHRAGQHPQQQLALTRHRIGHLAGLQRPRRSWGDPFQDHDEHGPMVRAAPAGRKCLLPWSPAGILSVEVPWTWRRQSKTSTATASSGFPGCCRRASCARSSTTRSASSTAVTRTSRTPRTTGPRPIPIPGRTSSTGSSSCFRWPPRSPIRCSRCSAIRRCWHIPMCAGDVLVHDIRLVHGSHRSRSEGLRRTLYYEFQSLAWMRREGVRPGAETRIDGTWGKARIRLHAACHRDPPGVSLRGARDSVRLPGAGGIRCRAAFREESGAAQNQVDQVPELVVRLTAAGGGRILRAASRRGGGRRRATTTR